MVDESLLKEFRHRPNLIVICRALNAGIPSDLLIDFVPQPDKLLEDLELLENYGILESRERDRRYRKGSKGCLNFK